MLATVATLPAISPTFLNVGINFLVNQLFGSGPEAELLTLTVVGLLKFNKWVGEEEVVVEVVCTRMRQGKAALG